MAHKKPYFKLTFIVLYPSGQRMNLWWNKELNITTFGPDAYCVEGIGRTKTLRDAIHLRQYGHI